MSDIHVHHHYHSGNSLEVKRLLEAVLEQGEQIMATQQELVNQVNEVTATVRKIGGEVGNLLTKVDHLEQVIRDNPVSQSVLDAVAALKAQAQVVDDLVPDSVPVPPTN